jgi:NAD(P)-dependent dehydrogenase (short-subunit alcohol dehydrogenase family)
MLLADLNPLGRFFCDFHYDTYPAIDSVTKSNLKGRSVFITGASRGIGHATAISYAKAGASQIALGARSDLSSLEAEMFSAAKAAGKPEPKILRINLDVQSRQSVENAARETEKAFGGLDILVNNAGYLENSTKLLDSDLDEYWKTWEINYRGVYWVTKAFLPMLIKTKGGLQTIVNVSSIAAHGLRPGGSSYQTSKNALLRFTEFLCSDYADKGILAYAVHPGGVMTELGSRMPEETHKGEPAFSCFYRSGYLLFSSDRQTGVGG